MYDSVGGELFFFLYGEKATYICFHADTCLHTWGGGHLHVEITICAGRQEQATAESLKNGNKPKHHFSCFSTGVLCKSNEVEHRAAAGYFCSDNALPRVKRTVFEVAPAGNYSRCHCATPPPKKKSLFSPNCCFPKSCTLTVLYRI